MAKRKRNTKTKKVEIEQQCSNAAVKNGATDIQRIENEQECRKHPEYEQVESTKPSTKYL